MKYINNLFKAWKRHYWLERMIKEAKNSPIKTKNPFKQSYQGFSAKSDFDGFTHLK